MSFAFYFVISDMLFFFKQKTAYEMRISDWSSDVCSSDLVAFGLAPDTNINNATSLDTIRVNLGDNSIPLTLDERARAKSGIGQTAQVSARMRLPVADRLSILADLDGNGTNYGGKDFDDYVVQLAAGADYALTPTQPARPEERRVGKEGARTLR